MKKLVAILIFLMLSAPAHTQDRWEINKDGGITWKISEGESHSDHIEMSGEMISAVLRYGVDKDGAFRLNRSLVFPMLRTVPNNTHASLMQRFDIDMPSLLIVNGGSLTRQKTSEITLDGVLTINSTYAVQSSNYGPHSNGRPALEIQQKHFPSTTKAALVEIYTLKNITSGDMTVLIPEYCAEYGTDPEKGVDGAYILNSSVYGSGIHKIKPGGTVSFSCSFTGRKGTENKIIPDAYGELNARKLFVTEMWDNLVLETPDPVIDRMFAFAKIRACESIYKTKAGYFHGPGGESYYAAIWANDQAEYVNPFFPFVGYGTGNKSAVTSFGQFARYMNDEYKPIPSSIIAEGLGYWNGAGDRGDAAMIAYGASRFALAYGDRKTAEELWPLIEWCLEFGKRKTNEYGVVESDSDELEGRFPAGKANLCTSTLHYDALLSAYYLGKDLGIPSAQLKRYKNEAEALRNSIGEYFGANVQGYDTYRYYDGNDVLRSWICMPLIIGINDRSEATLAALFSEYLWTENGLLTQAGSTTFWDRSTLYAFRGAYAAGHTELATQHLKAYSEKRLLGNHVPYAIEAYPEGNQRHLSAESGLYCRIITEGMLGIRPTGLSSFDFTPRLPQEWPEIKLRNIRIGGKVFDISVERKGSKLICEVTGGGKTVVKKSIKEGETVAVGIRNLPEN